MKRIGLRKLAGLGMAVLVCIQPLAASASNMAGLKPQEAEIVNGKIVLAIENGVGTVTAEAEGYDPVTIGQDTGEIKAEYAAGTVVRITVTAGAGYEIADYAVKNGQGEILEEGTDFPDGTKYETEVVVQEEQKRLCVSFQKISGCSGKMDEKEENSDISDNGGAENNPETIASQQSRKVVPGREDTVGYTAEEIQRIVDETLIVEEINGKDVDSGEFQTEEDLDAATGKNDTVVLSQLEENREIREQNESFISKLMNILSPALAVQASSAGATAAITHGAAVSYVGWTTHVYTVKDSSGSYTGFCLQPNSASPSGSFTTYELNNNVIKFALALYWADGVGCVTVDGDTSPYAATHAFAAYVYSGQTTGLNDSIIYNFDNLKNQIAGYFVNGGDPAISKDGVTYYMSQIKLFYAPNAAQDIAWINVQQNGKVNLKKTSANTSITDGSNCYSLEGAQYGVYSDSACTAKKATLTTDASGNSNTVELAAGTYYVKEITAPKGFAKDEEVHKVIVTPNQTVTVKVTDEPLNDPAAIEIEKIDAETGSAYTQGAASLAGAQFKVKYYDGYYTEETLPEEAARTWVLETREETWDDGTNHYVALLNDDHKIDGDEFYRTGNIICLPLGTVTVEEISAPMGYVLAHAYLQAKGTTDKITGIYIAQINEEDGMAHLTGGNEYSVSDRVARGDFEFMKRDEETKEAMAGIPFRITSNTTGESHVIVTDGNGYYSSASEFNKHSYHTNANDSVQDGKYDEASGLWFGLDADGENVAVDDGYGALPYDTYTIEELRCGQNEDKALYKGTMSISRDGYTVDIGTIENPDLAISTVVKDEDTNTHYAVADDEVALIDTVSYTGLKKGQEYTLKGTLMDKAAGKAVLDAAGDPVTAEQVFAPKTAEGTVEVTFVFDGSSLKGEDVVVYESLYLGTELVAIHQDLGDEDQTIHFPGIGTTTADSETGTNLSKADEEIKVVDTVAYRNLQQGRKYTVTGILMDKESGKPVKDAEGEILTSSVVFTPEDAEGTVEVVFVFDGSGLAGKTLVAFESLERNGRTYAVHADLEDEGQTIHIPEIGTTALDQETGTRMSLADGQVTIVDTVVYHNLVPGKTYTVKGTLMNQETGRVTKVNASREFTPQEPDGTVELAFTFDGSGLDGRTYVALEELFFQEASIAEHKDPADEGQTVHLPKVRTQALDQEYQEHLALADGDRSIVDTVKYENVIPELSYTVKGILMDPETGTAYLQDGGEVTAEQVFMAGQADGEVELTFQVDAFALAGRSLTVYEELYCNPEGTDPVLVGSHCDLEDEDQTVHYPEIGTTATDSKTKTDLSKADEEITVIDTVNYRNVEPGREYTITGVLMDKETGESALDAEGKEITAEAVITPERRDGEAEVIFVFDGSNLSGKTLVAFETLERNGRIYAVHADLEDEGQTIYIPKIGTTALDAETGTHLSRADEKITVEDTVSYENLMPGRIYTVKGTLMDRKTGKAVEAKVYLPEEMEEGDDGSEADRTGSETSGGNEEGTESGEKGENREIEQVYRLSKEAGEVTAEVDFTPENASGEVVVTFVFDGSDFAGETFVIYEEVFYEGVSIAEHKDSSDEGQSIHVPKIGTTATDPKTGKHEIEAVKSAALIDNVAYENLVPGRTYTVKGWLMDQNTGEAFQQDSRKVETEMTFVPEQASGTVTVEFSLDASELSGKKLTVFEELYLETELVAEHKDIMDDNQTVIVKEKEQIVTSTPGNTGGGVKTGDPAEIWMLLAVMAAAVCAVVACLVYCKRNGR